MAQIGDNLPPSDHDIELDRLKEAYRSLEPRRDDLVGAASRLDEEIQDEDRARLVADQGRQLRDTVAEWQRYREANKRPWLERGKAVDGYFGSLTHPLEEAMKPLRKRLAAWNDRKAAAERARRDEYERRRREEADQLAAKAMADAAAMDAAMRAATEAEDAAQAAAEPVKVQTRGTYGGDATVRKSWKCTSFERDKLDLNPLRPYLDQAALEKAIRSFIKAGGRNLEGAIIEEVSETQFR